MEKEPKSNTANEFIRRLLWRQIGIISGRVLSREPVLSATSWCRRRRFEGSVTVVLGRWFMLDESWSLSRFGWWSYRIVMEGFSEAVLSEALTSGSMLSLPSSWSIHFSSSDRRRSCRWNSSLSSSLLLQFWSVSFSSRDYATVALMMLLFCKLFFHFCYWWACVVMWELYEGLQSRNLVAGSLKVEDESSWLKWENRLRIAITVGLGDEAWRRVKTCAEKWRITFWMWVSVMKKNELNLPQNEAWGVYIEQALVLTNSGRPSGNQVK